MHQGGQQGLRAVVGEHLGGAQHEQRGQQRTDADRVAGHGQGEDGEHPGPQQVDHTTSTPVHPSVTAPATRPNSSGGSHCTPAARETRNGSRVSEATSSGPAARAMPSPRLEVHEEASSQRNPVPSRAGTTVSTMRPTGR